MGKGLRWGNCDGKRHILSVAGSEAEYNVRLSPNLLEQSDLACYFNTIRTFVHTFIFLILGLSELSKNPRSTIVQFVVAVPLYHSQLSHTLACYLDIFGI